MIILKNKEYAYNTIAGEMINIETGMRVFHDGQLCEEKKPGHNTYIISGIEYDVHPVVGVVIFLGTIDFNTLLTAKFNMNIVARNKHAGLKLTSGICGTSQYVLLDYQNSNQDSTLLYGCPTGKVSKYKSPFTWLIYDESNLNNAPIVIPELSHYYSDIEADSLLSLSTVIYDPDNFYTLPHGYKSPDYPSVGMLTMCEQGKLCREKIKLCGMSGVLPEIINTENKLITGHRRINQPIHWMDWADIDIYENLNSSIEPLEFLTTNQIDTLTKKTNRKYRCFFSGVDIAEDCYVVDIYRQQIGKKTIAYDKPQHLLVSAHLFEFDTLETRLGKTCEFILYRTFCPVTMKQLIEKMPIDPLHKKILHSANAGFKSCTSSYVVLEVDGKQCYLYTGQLKTSYLYKERNTVSIIGSVIM